MGQVTTQIQSKSQKTKESTKQKTYENHLPLRVASKTASDQRGWDQTGSPDEASKMEFKPNTKGTHFLK